MNEIIARYTNKAIERDDGLSNKECPLCNRIVFELDMEQFYEEGGKRQLECCTQCREDFESETSVSIDCDTLTPNKFRLLWNYGIQAMKSVASADTSKGLTEENAETVAQILGGEAWQSGGGIMLILFRRKDGRIVVLSDDAVCEYASNEAFDENRADLAIRFR